MNIQEVLIQTDAVRHFYAYSCKKRWDRWTHWGMSLRINACRKRWNRRTQWGVSMWGKATVLCTLHLDQGKHLSYFWAMQTSNLALLISVPSSYFLEFHVVDFHVDLSSRLGLNVLSTHYDQLLTSWWRSNIACEGQGRDDKLVCKKCEHQVM